MKRLFRTRASVLRFSRPRSLEQCAGTASLKCEEVKRFSRRVLALIRHLQEPMSYGTAHHVLISLPSGGDIATVRMSISMLSRAMRVSLSTMRCTGPLKSGLRANFS